MWPCARGDCQQRSVSIPDQIPRVTGDGPPRGLRPSGADRRGHGDAKPAVLLPQTRHEGRNHLTHR